MSSPNFPGLDDKRPATSEHPPFTGNGYSGLRAPSLDNTTYILILLVVLIPVTFTLIICAITYCIYRHNKRRSDRAPTNSTIVSTDRSGGRLATIIYNSQHSPYIFEESPPAYHSLAEIKKDPHGLITDTNTTEQFRLTPLTITNEEVTAAANIPSAPTPPPFYENINKSNKY